MTRLRKLAVKISDTVVRRCPPACKDWAQATARELEFVESDWAALRWALGSWKMAASCQNALPASMSEVPRAARNFLRETRVSTVLTWFSLLGTSYWFSFFVAHIARQASLRLGWWLIIAAMAYIVCDVIVSPGRRFPRGGGLPEVAAAYRSALVHQRDLLSGVWCWSRMAIIMPGCVMSAYRLWLMKPSAAREIMLKGDLVACGIMVLTLIVTRPMNRRIVARYQRTIDQLDALEGDGR
jgi:hypothetical protein